MKKLFSIIAALTLCAGLWADTETVSYRYPVYNTPDDPTSGIKEWQTGSVNATVVESSDDVVYWGTGGQTTWYVVTGLYGEVRLSKGAICNGNVNLILDSGTLYASAENNENGGAGIEVSGSNSLTIYGLDANLNATGERGGAGIGGGNEGSGSNITINGGQVTANGNGDAAGIGGGAQGNGSNITINGGIVTATGGGNGAGIGGGSGQDGSNIIINGGQVTAYNEGSCAAIGGGNGGLSSNIFVATPILLMAGSTSSNAIETPHFTDYDMAAFLKDKQYVKVEEGIATAYVEGYNAGKAEGDAAGYARGKAAGKAEAAAALPTDDEGTTGHTVTITKGDKTLTLINPDKVTYGKQD